MDLDKALYMSEFLKMREDLGTTEIYPVTNTLIQTYMMSFNKKKKSKKLKKLLKKLKIKQFI